MKKIRDYNKLFNEIINLNLPVKIEYIGSAQYDKEIYPMIAIKHTSKTAKKTCVIVGGAHGDEYYATRILVKFLPEINNEYLEHYNLYIFPIINPFGYSTGSRKNGARQDVSSVGNFKKDSDVQELAILYEHIPTNIDLFIDMHGDTGKHFLYAYEKKPEPMPSISEKALLEVDAILPFEKVSTIYKEKVKNGVIYKPEDDSSLEDFMEGIGVEYSIALEIPGKAEGQPRTKAGIALLHSLLKNYKEIK